jgi:hypothetical protein
MPPHKSTFSLTLRACSRASGRSVPIRELIVRATGRADVDILQLAFETKHLRTLCESSADAISELGQEVAYALIDRVADLDSAVSIKDVLVSQPQAFDNGELILELATGYRLLCRANHPNNPKTTSGAIDWEKVSRVKIVDIVKSS